MARVVTAGPLKEGAFVALKRRVTRDNYTKLMRESGAYSREELGEGWCKANARLLADDAVLGPDMLFEVSDQEPCGGFVWLYPVLEVLQMNHGPTEAMLQGCDCVTWGECQDVTEHGVLVPRDLWSYGSGAHLFRPSSAQEVQRRGGVALGNFLSL